MSWTLATRTEKMNPSVIREILKLTEKPGIVSLAGGLPSPRTFRWTTLPGPAPRCCSDDAAPPCSTPPARATARCARRLQRLPWDVDPAQVLITTGSQQGLDLVAKVLIDTGSRVLVETPTYLGALQAFTPMEPVVSVASDDEGAGRRLPAKAGSGADKARFCTCCPTSRTPPAAP
jgi:2-aminoadipate transaminase